MALRERLTRLVAAPWLWLACRVLDATVDRDGFLIWVDYDGDERWAGEQSAYLSLIPTLGWLILAIMAQQLMPYSIAGSVVVIVTALLGVFSVPAIGAVELRLSPARKGVPDGE